jgi:hypothetical protein
MVIRNFPSLRQFETYGFTPFGLKKYGPNEANINRRNEASLNAFAQREMTQVFMNGIDNRTKEFIQLTLGAVFDGLPALIAQHLGIDAAANKDKLERLEKELTETLKQFQGDLGTFEFEEFSKPVIDAIRYLEKSDLASMAESLVAITALKRRVTLGAETVGGPIDVAVISKGDGFIWIKRKHYFDWEYNQSFMQRYLPRGEANDAPQAIRPVKAIRRRKQSDPARRR